MSDGLQFNNPVEIQPEEAVVISQEDLDNMGIPAVGEPIAETPTESTNPVEIEEAIPETMLSDYIPEVANFLFEKGIFSHVPEGIDKDSFDEEALIKTITHDRDVQLKDAWEKAVNQTHTDIANRISPMTTKLLQYNLNNPNADDADIRDFLKSISESEFVSQLDADTRPEQVVREYYEKVMKWDKEEVDKEVISLVEGDKLKDRATYLKPKLQDHITSISKSKEQQSQAMRNRIAELDKDVENRLFQHLKKGELYGTSLTREQGSFLSQAILNNEVPVNVRGKRVNMGYAEALVMQNKYSNDPQKFQNLMLGLLVMQEGLKLLTNLLKHKQEQKRQKML